MFLCLCRRGGRVTGSRTGRTKTERERWELGVDCDRWKEGEATGLCDLDVWSQGHRSQLSEKLPSADQ